MEKYALAIFSLFLVVGCDDPAFADDAIADPALAEPALDDVAELDDLADAAGPSLADEWESQPLALPTPEPVAKVLSNKSGYQVFHWKKGMGDVPLGALTDKTCFLAGLNGTLASSSDRVEIEPVGEQWVLRGFGNAAAASAVCVATSFAFRSDTITWTGTEGSFVYNWTPVANKACFLTRLSGKLDGTASGASTTGARVYKSGDGSTWIFNVEGNTGSVVGAKARCIQANPGKTLTVSDEIAWTAGEAPLLLSSGVDLPCMLTHVTGTVASPGDWVGLWLSELQATLRQNLGGNKFTQTNGLTVKTRCVNVTP
jgi:hypothetical protein